MVVLVLSPRLAMTAALDTTIAASTARWTMAMVLVMAKVAPTPRLAMAALATKLALRQHLL